MNVPRFSNGAKWIWGLAEEHFPGATQIVDLYHAREHLTQVAKLSARWEEFWESRATG